MLWGHVPGQLTQLGAPMKASWRKLHPEDKEELCGGSGERKGVQTGRRACVQAGGELQYCGQQEVAEVWFSCSLSGGRGGSILRGKGGKCQ